LTTNIQILLVADSIGSREKAEKRPRESVSAKDAAAGSGRPDKRDNGVIVHEYKHNGNGLAVNREPDREITIWLAIVRRRAFTVRGAHESEKERKRKRERSGWR